MTPYIQAPMNERNATFRGRLRGVVAASGAVLMLLAAGACDALDNALEVEAASRIPAGDLTDPSKAPLLLLGTVADFECAFNAYVVMSGIVGEELIDATQTAS